MSTRWLGYMCGGAYLVYGFTGAVSILIQYSWKKKKNPEKSRKAAIAVSVITIVLLIFIATVLVAWFNEKFALRIAPRAFYALTLIAIALSHIFLRKNRPSETGCHERSLTIKRKVVLASYITLIILTITVGTHSNIISHLRRNTPLITPSMLPISLFLMLIIVVYSLTILIHYGWGDKNGK
jgi:amino acid transporter